MGDRGNLGGVRRTARPLPTQRDRRIGPRRPVTAFPNRGLARSAPRPGFRPALSRRSSSPKHLPDRWRTDAVRLHRVQQQARLYRRVLRIAICSKPATSRDRARLPSFSRPAPSSAPR
jgi:hypothetical protein